MTGPTRHRADLHHATVETVSSILRRRGIAHSRANAWTDGHDLVVNGLRVRVVAAGQRTETVRRCGGRYVYQRTVRRWNLHRHGQLGGGWDVAVLVGCPDGAFVVPRAAAALTVQTGTSSRASKWDRFREAWAVLSS